MALMPKAGTLAEPRFEFPSVDHVIANLGIVWGSSLFAIAVATIKEGKILAANPYFLSSVEYSEKDLIGRTSTELGLWVDLNRHEQRRQNILRNNEEVNEMVTLRTKTGKIKYFLVSSTRIFIKGVPCIVGTGTDITEQINIKDRLGETNRLLVESKQNLSVAKAAAENASLAKGAFLANMSHEIRTPLSIILGFVELLLEESWPDKHAQYLHRVQSSSLYLRELIDKVLDMSKIEAKDDLVNPSKFVLREKLTDALEALATQAKLKNIEFKFDLDNAWGLPLNTDRIRLIQIVNNLCSNAIKFTDSGRVELTGHVKKIDRKKCLCLRVTDTGIGIPKDKQEALFKLFSQVHARADFSGAGLGLYLSRQLARKLGGDVELIESIEGKGSIFEARILTDLSSVPTVHTVSELESNSQDAFSLRNLKILAAEDNESMRMIIDGMVRQLGGTVMMVQDGVELMSVAETLNPQLILLDNRMPKMNGLDAAKLLRKKGFAGKIVALTASAFEQQRDELIDAGCDDVLTKPFNLSSFTAVLKRQLGENRSLVSHA